MDACVGQNKQLNRTKITHSPKRNAGCLSKGIVNKSNNYCKYGLYPGSIDKKMTRGAVLEILAAAKKYINKPLRSVEVLEVGSGRGGYALEMSKHFKDVTGVDPYDEAYKSSTQLAKNVKNLTFKNVAVENYKTNKKYDVIVALTVIEHMNNQHKSFNKM